MAKELPAPATSDAPNSTCRVVISKEKVKDLSVSDPVTFSVSGTIKSLQPLFSDNDQYEVEIENPLVEKTDCGEPVDSGNENAATMPKEKLKEIISKALDEGK